MATNIPALLLERIALSPEREAFRYPRAGGWAALSWREVGERVRELAAGLRAAGLQVGERCAILSTTRIEWILADLAILGAGGATTTIYSSNPPDACAFILRDSEAVMAFVEDAGQLAKLRACRGELPALRKVVLLEGEPAEDDGWVLSLAQLTAMGRARLAGAPLELEEMAAQLQADALATLIYTSGTTGRPKGVELSHDCWLYVGEAIEQIKLLSQDDLQLLWLPLAHSFGKVLEVVQIRLGFSSAVDGSIERLPQNLAEVQPTFFCGVPRIFEKVHNRVVVAATANPARRAIFGWAMKVGAAASKVRQGGGKPGPLLALQLKLADRLVFSTIRARFGSRLRFFVSGSAALSREVASFFDAVGVLILEGYGLTETSAAIAVNLPWRFRLGTVGPVLPGSEVRIAADGEVLFRGRGVMRRYHGLPEATAETLDPDGWLHTGDIGRLDEAGHLQITDRKKDLIKTSGGKYVAPQAIEGRLKAICPYVSQVLVHGNNRNFCSALVTLDVDAVSAWARERGIPADSAKTLAGRREVHELLQHYFDRLNATLASYETIKVFEIVDHEFSEQAGELTASLKLKRKVIEQRYQPILDSFYRSSLARVGPRAGAEQQPPA